MSHWQGRLHSLLSSLSIDLVGIRRVAAFIYCKSDAMVAMLSAVSKRAYEEKRTTHMMCDRASHLNSDVMKLE